MGVGSIYGCCKDRRNRYTSAKSDVLEGKVALVYFAWSPCYGEWLGIRGDTYFAEIQIRRVNSSLPVSLNNPVYIGPNTTLIPLFGPGNSDPTALDFARI